VCLLQYSSGDTVVLGAVSWRVDAQCYIFMQVALWC